MLRQNINCLFFATRRGLCANSPGLEVGAYVEILPFNAFKWAEQIKKFTHTHLTSAHRVIEKNKKLGSVGFVPSKNYLWL